MIKNLMDLSKKRLIVGAFFISLAIIYFYLTDYSTHQLVDLYKQKSNGVMVTFEAKVINILSDDNQGSRHQRLIVEKPPLTVLIAHNIDLSERVPVKIGDYILVKGQYEWNQKGGIVHWTHSDPRGQHKGGWIEFRGQKYGEQLKTVK
ncbi:MAG: DUF3465 domain-containing protein [Proteobacteria bacterium]|nr:DUF3465 domain-containing protein [Pseudomonadota bacterium]